MCVPKDVVLQPFIDAVWMYFLLRYLEVRKYGGDWKDVFLFGDGLKVKTSPTPTMCKLVMDLVEFSFCECDSQGIWQVEKRRDPVTKLNIL